MQQNMILIDHGSGGKASRKLISEVIVNAFGNPILNKMDDSAVIPMLSGGKIAFSTDSFIVDPIFFPGGDIGTLAVYGTVNDLAMCGAIPKWLSVAFVIREGFDMADFKKIVDSMKKASEKSGVSIVTGDTKVMPHGALDQIIINTSGIGIVSESVDISSSNACKNDLIILSGTIGDHAIAVLSGREGFGFETPIVSDSAPLNDMVKQMLEVSNQIHVMRDPTRGGLATALNEIALQSGAIIQIWENSVPIKKQVLAASQLLGFDPFYLANEGKLIAFVSKELASSVLEAMKSNPYGKDAAIIGEVTDIVQKGQGKVFLKTQIQGVRIMDMLTGESLPRIC